MVPIVEVQQNVENYEAGAYIWKVNDNVLSSDYKEIPLTLADRN